MNRILITADIHGSHSGWLTMTALLKNQDSLVVAGDLFDTRYGNYAHPDFQPDEIRTALADFSHPLHYVYGNCDAPGFAPGYSDSKIFKAFGKQVYLHHGHKKLDPGFTGEIVIQGHTHQPLLEACGGKIFFNPGSIVRPKTGRATYGVMDQHQLSLIDLKTGEPIKQARF